VFALSFHGVAFALNARRRAHFSKSGSSQHCVRLGVNLKLAREIHSAHIAGRLRSQAARYADLETRGLAQMPLVPEGVLRPAGAPDPVQRGAADGALCPGASGRGEVVGRSAAKLGWIVVARGVLAVEPRPFRGSENWDHILAGTNDDTSRFDDMSRLRVMQS
jgi:hypothetical protein